MERQILHVDVNNAFLSWTAVDMLQKDSTLDIRTIPSIIGGDETQRKGIVLSKSTPAKQFGIKTAEPIFYARKKCPNVKVYPADHELYRKCSDSLYQLLLEYTDKIERFSIDECFMDMTGYLPPKEILLNKAIEINRRVREELGFTVNVGVANNKLLAKMASDFQKPDRVHTLFSSEIRTKMWILPIDELFMVGKRTLPKLENMGIHTIGDLAKRDAKDLTRIFGKFGRLMWEYANGIDNSSVEYQVTKPKGVGNSITLPKDVTKLEELNEILLGLAEHVSYRLRKHQMLANVINVQLKTKEFKTFSHQKRTDIGVNTTKAIYEMAKELLKKMYEGQAIRLIGLRADSLINEGENQISIFEEGGNKKQEELDKAVDKIKDKYGYTSITRGGNMHIKNIEKLKQ